LYRSKNALVAGMGWNIFLQNTQALIEVFGFFTVRDFLMKKRYAESNLQINSLSALVRIITEENEARMKL